METDRQSNPTQPIQSQAQYQPPQKRKMNKKEKNAMSAGAGMLIFAATFIIVFFAAPQIAAQIEHCNPFAMGGDNMCHGYASLAVFGFFGLFLCVPLFSIGAALILYSCLRRKGVKNPGAISTLILALVVLIIVFCVFIFTNSLSHTPRSL